MQTLTLIATGGTIACRAGEEGLAPHLPARLSPRSRRPGAGWKRWTFCGWTAPT